MSRPFACISLLFAALSLAGCGSGGPSGGGSPALPASAPAPQVQVLPATFDFGRVTSGNASAPLEVTVRNGGTAVLGVSSIGLTGSAFRLDLNGGRRPCATAAPTVAAGDSCTFAVTFEPSANGSFTGNVQIASNDTRSPVVGLSISGASEALNAIAVRVNQVDTACPSNAAKAYVSVLDQGGFPVTGLNLSHFSLTEGASPVPLTNATFVDAAFEPLAIAAVVDNSASITDQPVAFTDMKTGFASFFNGMRANDVGELIAFGSVFAVRVPFPAPSSTSNPTNKAALVSGLEVPWSGDANSLLYDSVFRAVDDAAQQTGYRRGVIVATDGIDEGPSAGSPLSTHTLAEVIDHAVAKGVPVFTIGLGNAVNAAVLQDLATRTGGVFYQASTSQNLATIYQQLSSLLLRNQYVLAFDQLPLGAGTPAQLNVSVTTPNGVSGTGTGPITSCN